VTVFPRYDEPGVYERKLEFSAVGRYEIEAVAKLKKEELGRDKAFFACNARHRRVAATQPKRWSCSKRLASENRRGLSALGKRGLSCPPPARCHARDRTASRQPTLWDRAWVFALIIGLLCGEWFLRKRNGLP